MTHDVEPIVRARLEPVAAEWGVRLPSSAWAPLACYADSLLRWNRRINLTGAVDLPTLVDEHLADALALLPPLPEDAIRLLDVGSGAGLPGVVLALARPDLEVVLLEPRDKRHAFLQAMRRELPLPRVEVRRARLEALEPGPEFSVLVSRAVWPPGEWLSRCAGWWAHGAWVLAQTGSQPPADLPPDVTPIPYRLAGRMRHVLVRAPAPPVPPAPPVR